MASPSRDLSILDCLTERERQTVELVVGENLPGSEVARRMQISERRQRALIRSARKRLAGKGLILPARRRGRSRVSVASQCGADGIDFDTL